jgi:methionyl-tRNA synthetase
METKRAVELSQQPVEPAKAEISFDDFSKMDIRIGTILKAERVEKSKKLLKLQVDTGIDVRTVMSGIAEHFAPEDILGKKVTILVNLAPRKIMGVESQGMILMASDKDGSLKLLSPSGDVAPGAHVS